MTEWNKIYSKVHISGTDGFTFVTIPNISIWEEESEAFIKRLMPADKHDNEFAMKRAMIDPVSALRMYLCRTMSSTFCIGHGERDGTSVYYVGGRRPQDIFKLILKIPESKKTRTWDTGIEFSIRVAENDNFDPEKFKNGITLRGMT